MTHRDGFPRFSARNARGFPPIRPDGPVAIHIPAIEHISAIEDWAESEFGPD